MPPQKHHRCRKVALTAASGALILICGAGPASAATSPSAATHAVKCPEGTNLIVTVTGFLCRTVDGVVKVITGGHKTEEPEPRDPSPAKPKPREPTRPDDADQQKKRKPVTSVPDREDSPGTAPNARFKSVGPAVGEPGRYPGFPEITPDPMVAPHPQQALVTPAADKKGQYDPLTLSVASGLAGAVAAMHLSLVGRGRRRIAGKD